MLGTIQLILIVLKLFSVITISWFWVLSPIIFTVCWILDISVVGYLANK